MTVDKAKLRDLLAHDDQGFDASTMIWVEVGGEALEETALLSAAVRSILERIPKEGTPDQQTLTTLKVLLERHNELRRVLEYVADHACERAEAARSRG